MTSAPNAIHVDEGCIDFYDETILKVPSNSIEIFLINISVVNGAIWKPTIKVITQCRILLEAWLEKKVLIYVEEILSKIQAYDQKGTFLMDNMETVGLSDSNDPTVERCWLVAKLFTTRPFNHKERVMDGALWTFDRKLLAFHEYDGNLCPSDYVFTEGLFWIGHGDFKCDMTSERAYENVVKYYGERLKASPSVRGNMANATMASGSKHMTHNDTVVRANINFHHRMEREVEDSGRNKLTSGFEEASGGENEKRMARQNKDIHSDVVVGGGKQSLEILSADSSMLEGGKGDKKSKVEEAIADIDNSLAASAVLQSRQQP
ncbi:hypothetical protein PTKIN_Ptkin03bG0117500 [Pterospermum kingtungense]